MGWKPNFTLTFKFCAGVLRLNWDFRRYVKAARELSLTPLSSLTQANVQHVWDGAGEKVGQMPGGHGH